MISLTATVVASAIGVSFLSSVFGAVLLFLRRISDSVGLAAPTSTMLAEENPSENCALFRHLPSLSNKLAWRSLGATGKTPVHTCRLPSLPSPLQKKGGKPGDEDEDDDQDEGEGEGSSVPLEFYVKREDLICPSTYGGNKVRTLQHQLAVCEARRENGETAFRQLVSVGTGGSNQVVATVVHARGLGWDGVGDDGGDGDGDGDPKLPPPRINVCWPADDAPDLDNTLNMLSVLSFPHVGYRFNWGGYAFRDAATCLRNLRDAWTQRALVPMMPGGNCPAGVLGQVGAVLELSEQIEAGDSPDPSRIYVPVGSGCTVSGLIVGTVLVRRLGPERSGATPASGNGDGAVAPLSRPGFRIVGCNVHHAVARMDRTVDFHTNPAFRFVPLTIVHTVTAACRALTSLGGPDLLSDALRFVETGLELRSDGDVVGRYGAHSEKTKVAADRCDEVGEVVDSATGEEREELWLCGHFVAKAFRPLVDDLAKEVAGRDGGERTPVGGEEEVVARPEFMLWMTKSAVQPRGSVDEWEQMMRENDTVKQWAEEGKAESILRPGRVSLVDGNSGDYRSLMREIKPK